MDTNYYFYRLLIVVLLVNTSIGFTQQNTSKYINSELMQPPYLEKGDTVLIVATAGIIKDSTIIEDSVKWLNGIGLQAKLAKNLYAKSNHFAGTDVQRAKDLQEALDDPTIKAIWCARGGYGTVRIIDKIDFGQFKKHPKWLIGFSDITVLHSQIHNLGRESIHAIMPSTLRLDNNEQKKAQKSLKKALFGQSIEYKTSKSDFNKEGEAKGQLIGGNLSILYSTLGSKSALKTDGKILFIEDVGEYVYHIDRMLQNLKRNGYFKNCKGLIVGGISDIRENDTDFGKPVEQVILDVVSNYNFPVVFDFPAGHIRDNRTLILGREIVLKVKNKKATIQFTESSQSTPKPKKKALSTKNDLHVGFRPIKG